VSVHADRSPQHARAGLRAIVEEVAASSGGEETESVDGNVHMRWVRACACKVVEQLLVGACVSACLRCVLRVSCEHVCMCDRRAARRT
jgi:hypothetical protein